MKVLLAFDKFKGSLTAQEACRLAEDALFEIQPDLSIERAPLSDGGEGFCSILTEGLGGEIRDYTVTYPEIHPGSGQIGYVPLAEVSDEV
ncbi:MAG: glycerate kinase, partial [Opitutales bacterium]|nr:glycerate kinase [Opitutales bacterium]